MNKGFYYCHMCGSIIERDEVKQIISKDWTTGRKEKLFDVCPDCASKIEKLRLPPVNIKSRKKVKFYSVAISDFATRRSHKVYDVLSNQLDYIKSLEVDLNKLKLTYKTGSRLYTEFQVKKWLLLKRSNLLEGMYLLYQHQTDDEKKSRETKYANSVGFNKPDADFLSGMSRMYEDRGAGVFTKRQLKTIENKLLKYTKQITLYVNAEGMILKGV